MTRSLEVPRVAPEDIGRLGPLEQIVFIDARTIDAWAASHLQIPRSLRVPVDQMNTLLPHVPKGHPVVAYCASPHEAASACVALRMGELGFGKVFALAGGFDAWLRAGRPTTAKGAAMGEEPREDTPAPL